MAIDVPTIVDAYLDSADYAETGDCAQARTFETALTKLLVLPRSATHGQEEVTNDPQTLRLLLNDVKAWIASSCPAVTTGDSSSSGGAVHMDLSDFRQ